MKTSVMFVCMLALLCSVCCKTDAPIDSKEIQINTVVKGKKYCKDSLITVEFLKNATYKKAMAACNLTIVDREFALQEIVPFGIRKKFKEIFSKEELSSSKRFKEVKWESKDLDYIIVWYLKEGDDWQPFDHLKYGKDVRF